MVAKQAPKTNSVLLKILYKEKEPHSTLLDPGIDPEILETYLFATCKSDK